MNTSRQVNDMVLIDLYETIFVVGGFFKDGDEAGCLYKIDGIWYVVDGNEIEISLFLSKDYHIYIKKMTYSGRYMTRNKIQKVEELSKCQK